MAKSASPCDGCTRRHVGCHSTCEDGLRWETEHKQKNAAEDAARMRDYEMNGYKIERAERKRKAERKTNR